MEPQRGGAVRYVIRRLTDPKAVESYFQTRKRLGRPIPIPSQTFGTCGIDSLIAVLFYADEVRLWIWDWVFKNYVKVEMDIAGERYVIDVSDEALHPRTLEPTLGGYDEVLTKRRVDTFLATSAARVLRILEAEPETTTTTRAVSRTRAEEMHGSAPGEICGTLALLLARPGSEAVKDPRLRVEGALGYSFSAEEEAYAVTLISTVMGKTWASRTGGGAMGLSIDPSDVHRHNVVAIGTTLHDSINDKDMIMRQNIGDTHAVTLIRHNGEWHVSDDNIGILLPLVPTSPAVSINPTTLLTSFLELYMQKQLDGTQRCMYRLRWNSNWSSLLASTPEATFLKPDFMTRPGIQVMRESKGLFGGPLTPDQTRSAFAYLSSLPTPPVMPLGYGESMDILPAVVFLRRLGYSLSEPPNPSQRYALEKLSDAIAKSVLRGVNPEIGRYYLFVRGGTQSFRERRKPGILRGPRAAGASEGGMRRYSRKVRQWGSRRGVAYSTRRRGSRPRKM